ncbi:MAG: serine--tRNA ligase [Armatimonadetes bacterium]|nr:serine--tRNA ligase [Armatimonadota bacterium]
MLDRKIIREEPDRLREAIRNRGSDFDVDELIRLDERRRELLEVEQLKAERNRLSKEIGEAIKSGGSADDLKAQVADLKERIAAMEAELAEVDEVFDLRMLEVPNIPLLEVPVGAGEEDNVVIHERGCKPGFDFDPLPHWEIGERLGILSFATAAKMAGARFACDFDGGAQLERALMNLMLDTHTRQHGYTEVGPPFLANAQSLVGTGSLPKFEEDLFKTTTGHYLIPTAEVPLTNIHQGEILEAADLPKCYTAYTPCFRSEAGAAGRESRGLIRLHQFNKVELMKFTTPETAADELEKLTQNAEAILELLGLAYRRIILCTGDMGFGSERTYDLEVWMPGMGRWVEISSCSQYGDFQARRCDTRYRPEAESRPTFVHTMNGSGLAIGRSLAAILENYQQANGTVVVPEALRAYMGGRSEINRPLP